MAFKSIALFAILAVANAGVPQLYQAPVAQVYQQQPTLVKQFVPQVYQQSPTLVKQVIQSQPILTKTAGEEYDPNPQYSYSYDIQDGLTGDSKSQQESRNGDVVRGQYTVNDADGFKRIVDYTADPINGFNAIVSREPLAVKSIVSQPIVKTAPIAYAAPATYVKSTPLTYAAPTTYVKSTPLTYAAPASYVKSAYAAPVSYYNSAPLAYAAPTSYVKSAYAAPASYINAAPLSYASAPASYVKGNYY